MDTPVLLAIISTAGVLITALASVGVAFLTNRRESANAAEDAGDEATKQQLLVRDERITLRDEQLRAKEQQLQECLDKSAAIQGELHSTVQDKLAALTELATIKLRVVDLEAEIARHKREEQDRG